MSLTKNILLADFYNEKMSKKNYCHIQWAEKNFYCKRFLYHGLTQVKAAFHMIDTIAVIAGKKRSAIVAIMWKPLFRNRNDHSNHMETSLY